MADLQQYKDLINGVVTKPDTLANVMIQLHDMISEDLTARDAHKASETTLQAQLVESQRTAQQLFLRVTDPVKAQQDAQVSDPNAAANKLLEEMGVKLNG